MAKKADIGSKRLIGLDPDRVACAQRNRWVKWVTGIPEATAREIISTDFQWIGDVSWVVRVRCPRGSAVSAPRGHRATRKHREKVM